MKWHILYKMPIYPIGKQKKKENCRNYGGYNFIREHNSGDLDFDRVERDDDYEPTIPERYNKYVAPSDGSTSMPNAPTMDNFCDEIATAICMNWI
jgi:hypothetical protein